MIRENKEGDTMEKELASKIFMVNDYASKNNMEEQIYIISYVWVT